MLLLSDILLVFIKPNSDVFLWHWRNRKDHFFFLLMLYHYISLGLEKGFLWYCLSITWSSYKYFVQNSGSLIRNTEIRLLSSLIIPCVISNQWKLYLVMNHCIPNYKQRRWMRTCELMHCEYVHKRGQPRGLLISEMEAKNLKIFKCMH